MSRLFNLRGFFWMSMILVKPVSSNISYIFGETFVHLTLMPDRMMYRNFLSPVLEIYSSLSQSISSKSAACFSKDADISWYHLSALLTSSFPASFTVIVPINVSPFGCRYYFFTLYSHNMKHLVSFHSHSGEREDAGRGCGRQASWGGDCLMQPSAPPSPSSPMQPRKRGCQKNSFPHY